MELVGTTRSDLIEYVSTQIDLFFPDRVGGTRELIRGAMDDALDRLVPCVRLNKVWPRNRFDYLHSNQYATFLYFLANTLWQRSASSNICNKLYCLNKALNGLECYYTIELPEVFSICHSPGIVLAQATYANYLVLYQNVTVGRVDPDKRPVFEEGVIMFPNSAIVGDCRIGRGTVLAQGQSVIDTDTPGDCVVFNNAGTLVCRPTRTNYLSQFFRLDDEP
jgi:serine O-acetyltransferase